MKKAEALQNRGGKPGAASKHNTGKSQQYYVLYVLILYYVLIQIILIQELHIYTTYIILQIHSG